MTKVADPTKLTREEQKYIQAELSKVKRAHSAYKHARRVFPKPQNVLKAEATLRLYERKLQLLQTSFDARLDRWYREAYEVSIFGNKKQAQASLKKFRAFKF